MEYTNQCIILNNLTINRMHENQKAVACELSADRHRQPGISCQQTTERGGTGFSTEARGLAGHHRP